MAPGMTAHSDVGASAVHLRGVLLPDDDVADLWVAGDRISREQISGAETIMRGGWLLPGLVDVHTHPGADSPGDPTR
jgi:imidazolonepropionase-like amidohydrolase